MPVKCPDGQTAAGVMFLSSFFLIYSALVVPMQVPQTWVFFEGSSEILEFIVIPVQDRDGPLTQ